MTDRLQPSSGSVQGFIDLGQARLFVRERINTLFRRSDPAVREMMDHLAAADGKQFRAFLLLAAAADEDDQVPLAAVNAAAAVEILHLATLVHDDIIDDAPLRRGLASIQSRFGKKAAVLGGDYLFSMALTLIADIAEQHTVKYSEFSRAIAQICLGELSQHRHNHDANLSVFSYLRIIAGKTAALFALAMYAGAVIKGDSQQDARQLSHFGYAIGMHFQLADDCLDYETSTENMGKQTSKDLAEGVVTLPLILAMIQNPGLRQVVSRSDLSPTEIASVTAQVVADGFARNARQVAERYVTRARRSLARVSGPIRRERLDQLLVTIVSRSF